METNYITQELFDNTYDLAEKTDSKIGSFIRYLKQQKIINKELRTRNEER